MFLDTKIRTESKKPTEKLLHAPIKILSIFSAYDHVWNTPYFFAGESHKYHEVVYVVSGEVTATEDDRIFKLTEGSLIVHAPYEFHRISTESLAHVLVFTFDTDEPFPEALYNGYFMLNEAERRKICDVFKTIYAFYHKEESDDAEADNYLKQEISASISSFLLSLVRTHTYNPSSHVMTKSEEEYKSIIDTMKLHVCDNLSLNDIAELNRYAGIGAKEYYSTLRYNEIIRLCESGMPISEISDRLNFSSPEYLSLFFKKRMGVPPGKWKNTKK